jgi:hypothetical protein
MARDGKSWIDCRGLCQNPTCRGYLEAHKGIFCGNYSLRRGGFVPCQGAWCPGCYVPLGVRGFPIRQRVGDDGDEIIKEEDSGRFLCAQAGDHLLTPFQCEVCHAGNMLGRNLRVNLAKDRELKEMIRHANLDAFWSRETSTVGSNLKEARRMERTMHKYGLPLTTPPMGPWSMEDTLGMKAAIAVLDRLLNPGVYEANVQWDTFWKQKSTVTNISQASVGGLGNSVGAYERRQMWISNVVSHQFWSSRFMGGIHKRVGQVRKPDKELSIEVLHSTDRSSNSRKRGEEMMHIELAGTVNSVKHLDNAVNAHFKFIVLGRTKGNQLSGAKFGVPCVPATSGTNLRPGCWIKRLVATLHWMGRQSGRLFSCKLASPKMHKFANDWFSVLEKVQSTMVHSDAEVDI